MNFSHWEQELHASQLPNRDQRSFAIVIRWYLGFCRRGRGEVTHQSARDFIDWATNEKHPAPWQIEQWKEAIRWFFRHGGAKVPAPMEDAPDQLAPLPEGESPLPEVFGKTLGDLSEYRRAKVRPHLPVWLTREELYVFPFRVERRRPNA